MKLPTKKNSLRIIGFAVGLIAYYFGSIYLAGAVIDYPIFKHSNYVRLENWDLAGYVENMDIDGDNKDDFVHSTGCAYLSKAPIDTVPEERKCQVNNGAYLPSGLPEYGQKFLDLPTTSANWEELSAYMNIAGYAYAFKNEGQWFIVEKRGVFNQLRIYAIQDNGLLTLTNVPFDHYIFSWLYIITNILIIPTFFIFFLLSYLMSFI